MRLALNLLPLIGRWRSGNEEAACELASHVEAIIRARLSQKHRIPAVDLDDVGLDVLEAALHQLREGLFLPCGSSQLVAWIFVIAKGKAADYWRRSLRRPAAADLVATDREADLSVGPDQDLALEWQDWLAALPPRLSRAVRLHFVDGKDLAETAKVMRISEPRLRAVLGEAKRRLYQAAGYGTHTHTADEVRLPNRRRDG